MSAAADAVTDALRELHTRFTGLRDGRPADYIPQLALSDPDAFGLALISMDGHRYSAGDAEAPFTMQSVSKPFVYALALSVLGLDEVGRWVNAEPSGEAYNAISLEPDTGRPDNAMVNAGAIITTALIPDTPDAPRFDRILDCLSRFAGRRLDVDEQVYASEAATGDRNRALAYLIRSTGPLPVDPVAAVETYFRQCAVRVTALDLAAMAATLAHGGVNPLTGDAAVPGPVAAQVLAVMATCGMYDASGDWLLRVGLPAKSGVSGGLIAVGPARFGLATYSPRLDRTGTSVRGRAALGALSERLGLHLMHNPALAGTTVTLVATADELPSTGAAPQDRVPRERVAVVAAQGAIDFTAAERVLYALDESRPRATEPVVLDLGQVTGVDGVARAMLRGGLGRIAADGVRTAVADPAHRLALPGPGRQDGPTALRCFATRAEAVTWCTGGGPG
ncbi:glutaminase A [Streptomyces sp. NBC_01363]|uniref:glutaminase A n=1 Tax=Streptomyces sp. NBC_01363 TaxID=2903840 RepID=UPI002254ECD8|nr:glutaminase A [Streptomyces sp. NBC_01363]MCX4734092.1 glutaminase A [Streptomyces sp. NBC_01363]